MKYLGNLELELENLSSNIIKGIVYPVDYIDIVTYFSKIELVEISNEITEILDELMKKLKAPSGLMKTSQLESYFYGKNPELLALLVDLGAQVKMWIPLYMDAFEQKGTSIVEDLAANMEGQDFVGMGDAINATAGRQQELDNIHLTKVDLQRLIGVVQYLIPFYGSSLGKLQKKTIKPSLDVKYQLRIQDMVSNIEIYAGNMELAIVLGRVIQTMQAAFPKTTILDPYATQISENILKVLSHPEDYYTDCKMDRVLNDTVANVFQFCYPEFYQIYLNMYLDDYNKMDYEKQSIFRKCFAIPEDNSLLLALTKTYIQLGYT